MADRIKPPSTATIVITTKNRKDDLRTALKSCLTQLGQPEILVIDDGSTDGTRELVQTEFPTVRVDRSETSLGLIVQRNRAARLATGDVIFSIDDDAEFTTPTIVQDILRQFDDPVIGAVAIPFVNVNQGPAVLQRPPSPSGSYIAFTYIGTAHAVRRDVFLRLGGYREFFFHQGEEGDYCTRMAQAGYFTRLGVSDPINHYESPRRDMTRMDVYGRRNDILYVICNVPALHLPLHLLATTINGVIHGFHVHRIKNNLRGLLKGYVDSFRFWSERSPVSSRTYCLLRQLKKAPRHIAEIHQELPAPTPVGTPVSKIA